MRRGTAERASCASSSSTGGGVSVSASATTGAASIRRPCPGTGEGFGLISMRERAHAVGGTFDVDSRPGSGTMVEVVL